MVLGAGVIIYMSNQFIFVITPSWEKLNLFLARIQLLYISFLTYDFGMATFFIAPLRASPTLYHYKVGENRYKINTI